uniref:WD repeat containing planar cell polarity effector n=1 Tax=Labrus bergylta TaxID=56723 RepID=A0A3Q3F9R3_9LABR
MYLSECLAKYHRVSPKKTLRCQYRDPHLSFSCLFFSCCSLIARGFSWTPKNRRPEKLRDSLKEFEELLQTNTCVQTRWRSKHCCQVMMSSGVLVTMTLNGPQLEQVFIDRTLVGRLPANTVTDSKLHTNTYTPTHTMCNKQCPLSRLAGVRHFHPLCLFVVCVDVSGQGRRLHRRVGLNRLQDVALVWWNLDKRDEELWSWTPSNTPRNNVVLLSCSPTEGLKVLSSVRTEGNLLDCRFSLLQPYQLLTVEIPPRPQEAREGFWAHTCVYECARERLHRLSVIRIPLPSHPVSCSRHPSEVTLLLGLRDSSLVLYDQRRGVSFLAPCPLPPTLLAWHPAGAVAMVGGGQGELMCFDLGLAPLGMALLAEEVASAATLRLAQHLRCCGGLEGLWWGAGLEGAPEGTDILMFALHGGPLAALRFRLVNLLTGGKVSRSRALRGHSIIALGQEPPRCILGCIFPINRLQWLRSPLGPPDKVCQSNFFQTANSLSNMHIHKHTLVRSHTHLHIHSLSVFNCDFGKKM